MIYPNPATSTLTLKGISGNTEITFIDSFGKVALRTKSLAYNGNTVVDITKLKKGIYVVKSASDKNATLKLIKQ